MTPKTLPTATTVTGAMPTYLNPKEAAQLLKCSTSFLAKKRLAGDGPPYHKLGRSIRYAEAALLQWMKSRQRLSTSQN